MTFWVMNATRGSDGDALPAATRGDVTGRGAARRLKKRGCRHARHWLFYVRRAVRNDCREEVPSTRTIGILSIQGAS
jgi:hypothetical protein